MSHKTAGYTSELSDEQWARVRPLLPIEQWGAGRPIELDMRAVVNAMLYLVRTGCQWRNLPKSYPAPGSVYYHFSKGCKDRTWEHLNGVLVEQVRQQAGRAAQPSGALLDSQSTKTTSVGGDERGYDAGKKVKGRKRHILTDTLGQLLKVIVHAASLPDCIGARWLLCELPTYFWQTLKRIWADGGYRGTLLDWLAFFVDVPLQIVTRNPSQCGFAVLPKRWVVERTFAWLANYRRLSKDYEYYPDQSEGMIYLASIHRSLNRLAPKP